MTHTALFNFHGQVCLRIMSEIPQAISFFHAEYAHHAATNLPRDIPQVELILTRVPAPGMIRHTHKVLARWAYSVEVDSDCIRLRVSGQGAAIPMIHHMLVHPSLRYLAARSGTLLLHAGAVARGGRSLILTGQGGAGKTTTTSLALAYGHPAWSLHADDYVFINPCPVSYAYLTRSHLYRGLLSWLPELGGRLTRPERARLEIFGRIREWTKEGLKWPVRVPPERLWPGRELAYQAVPAAVVLLARYNGEEPEVRRLQFSQERVDELLEMNFGEARHFLALLEQCGRLEKGWLAQWRQSERVLIENVLQSVPLYQLTLPVKRGQTAEAGQQLAKALNAIWAGEGIQ